MFPVILNMKCQQSLQSTVTPLSCDTTRAARWVASFMVSMTTTSESTDFSFSLWSEEFFVNLIVFLERALYATG